jgi:hypothetical protein
MMYVDKTGAISATEQEGFYPVIPGFKPEPDPCCDVVEDKLQWAETHWIQLYKQQPKPLYSAGEWLDLMGVGSSQQPTLIYLRMKLTASGKQSAKLDSLETYLQQVLGAYAADNSPRCDWGQPPVTYYDAVKEAMEVLQS